MTALAQNSMASIKTAFTCRLPWAILILLGIKTEENRASLPHIKSGRCAVSCSSTSNKNEYSNFIDWAKQALPPIMVSAIPPWGVVEELPGKIIGSVDYHADEVAPIAKIWDEGLPYWWHISNPHVYRAAIPCKGKLGMWNIPEGTVDEVRFSELSLHHSLQTID